MARRASCQVAVMSFLCAVMILTPQMTAHGTAGPNAATATYYSEIDELALSVPDSMTKSSSDLAAYFSSFADTDTALVRAAYIWIVSNIRYGSVDHDDGVTAWVRDPGEILRNLETVCTGYCVLLESIAAEMGICTQRVPGYLKGPGGRICDQLEGQANHAWTAVLVSGKWHLLDCTQGSERVNSENRISDVRREFYFLTPPSQMIYDHFPYNPYWQLLDHKLTLSDFQRLPYVMPNFFELGLDWEDELPCMIEVDDSMMISLVVPADVVVSSSLKLGDNELDSLTFEQRDGTKYWIYARFPQSGEYRVDIYAGMKSDTGRVLHQALAFLVSATNDKKPAEEFPEIFATFGEVDAFLYEPLTAVLTEGENTHFKIRVPTALEVYLFCNNGDQLKLEQEGEVFERSVTVSRGDVKIVAKFQGDSVYTLVRYESK